MTTLRPVGATAPLDHPLALAGTAGDVVHHLAWYDGPLVTLFRAPDGRHAVFVWVDQSDTHNRWLAFHIPPDVAAIIADGRAPSPESLAGITNGALVDIGGRAEDFAVARVGLLALADMPDDLLSDHMRPMDVSHRLAEWLDEGTEEVSP